jgi:hypothetical protein
MHAMNGRDRFWPPVPSCLLLLPCYPKTLPADIPTLPADIPAQIMTGEDDALQLMESWKGKGNEAMRIADSLRAARSPNCSNFYRQAIRHYAAALAVRTSPDGTVEDPAAAALRIVCLANRAAAHLARGNFGLALRDCADADALYARIPPPPPPPPPPPAAAESGDADAGRLALAREAAAREAAAAPPGGAPQMCRVVAKCRARAAEACLRLRRCAQGPGEGARGTARGGSVPPPPLAFLLFGLCLLLSWSLPL